MSNIDSLINELSVLTHKDVELVKLDIEDALNKRKALELKSQILKLMCEDVKKVDANEDVKKVDANEDVAAKPKKSRKKKVDA